MDSIVDFVQNLDMLELSSNPLALVAVGILVVLAIIFRWKGVLLLLFAIGGALAVFRYSRISETSGFDANIVIFVVGSVVVGVILIYLTFIRGD